MAALFSTACGGGGEGGGVTQPPPPVPVLTLVEIEGNRPLDQGKNSKLVAWCSYSVGPRVDCSLKVLWSSSHPTVVTVVAGDVFAQGAGTSEVVASLDGKQASVVVEVLLPPWAAQWAMFTAAEKAFFRSTNPGVDGYTKRWPNGVVRVWAGPGISLIHLEAALSFWQGSSALKGRISFSLVTGDSALAEIVFRVDSALDSEGLRGICGEGKPTRAILGAITKAEVAIVSRPECAQNWDWLTLLYAHELGHTFGVGIAESQGRHTPGDGDVMGFPRATLAFTSLLSRVLDLLYSVPGGTVIQ